MNILFIGPYRQADGWGEGARNYLYSLLETGHNIVARPIYMGNSNVDKLDPRLEALEKKRYKKYHRVIQNVLPHLFYPVEGSKNIGVFTLESGGMDHTSWPSKMALMDELWVTSKRERDCVKDLGGVFKMPKVRVVKQSIDTSRYKRKFPPLEIEGALGRFCFYFIGEWTERKGLEHLAAAYLSEFHPSEQVCLIIKTSKPGLSPDQTRQEVMNMCDGIKRVIRTQASGLYDHPICVVSERLTDMQMDQLHATGDCFVMPSHGEAFCRPAIDAVGFGKRPIVTKHTGMNDFVNDANGYLIDSTEDCCLIGAPPISDLYTTNETWQIVTGKQWDAFQILLRQ